MNTVLAFGFPGGWEWIVIVLFVVIFFGAKKIPEIARGMGKGIREFKDATKEIKKEIEEEPSEDRTTSKS
jgi:sec-independent protein translocase protein TatA